MSLSIRVDVDGFDEIVRRLRDADKSIRRDTTHGCRDAGKDTLKRLKVSIKTMPVTGFKVKSPATERPFTADTPGGRIRRRIANVTRFRVRLVRMPIIDFFVDSDRLGNAREMPGYFDDERKVYHPLPGTRSAWAAVRGRRWFRHVVIRDLPAVARAIDRRLDQTRLELDGRT